MRSVWPADFQSVRNRQALRRGSSPPAWASGAGAPVPAHTPGAGAREVQRMEAQSLAGTTPRTEPVMELTAGSPLCCPEVPDGWGGAKTCDLPLHSVLRLSPAQEPLLTRATQLPPAQTTEALRDTGRVGARASRVEGAGRPRGSASLPAQALTHTYSPRLPGPSADLWPPVSWSQSSFRWPLRRPDLASP